MKNMMIIGRNFFLSGNSCFEMIIQYAGTRFICSEYDFHQVNKITK